jgi:YtoQ family protein
MDWNVYLSGEIHTDWREKIKEGTEKLGLPIIYTSAVTDHDSSDAAGDHLGKEDNNFWRDHCKIRDIYKAKIQSILDIEALKSL